MIKEKYKSLVRRFDSVMMDIGCEHLVLGDGKSEVYTRRKYYDVEDGITTDWMWSEATYWLSCYYESGNVRCDDRFIDKDCYKIWVSETGKLKRLIAKLEPLENDCIEED